MERDPAQILVRPARAADADAIAAIYDHYIAGTIITFEEESVGGDTMATRIADVEAAGLPWLVAERDGLVAGYAYATLWRPRRSYRHSTEVTVYVSHDCGGLGVGTALYGRLLPLLRERGYHVALGGIALPNGASVALHEKFGFRKVAHLEQVGFKLGRWIDVGYWELLL